jgi:hypothetical protein
MIRTRIDTDWPLVYHGRVKYTKPGSPDIINYADQQYFTRYSRIDDEVQGPRRYGLTRFSYRPVRHTRVTQFPMTQGTWASGGGYQADVDFMLGFDKPWVAETLFANPTPAEVGAAATQVAKAWATQIPSKVSIANFIYELRDVKSLLPQLMTFKYKFGAKASLEFLKNLGTISNNFLAYEFGWKPLLSDIKKLCMLVGPVTKRLQFLRDTYKRLTPVHGYKPDFIPFTPDVIPTYMPPPGQVVTVWVKNHYRADFRGGAFMYHNLAGLDGALGLLRAFTAALGLNQIGRIVWNAIPFSFLVEWFVKLDQFIDLATLPTFGGEMRITPAGSSVKETGRAQLWYRYQGELGNPWTFKGSVLVERYTRTSAMPIPATELFNPTLTGEQQLLLGALGHQALNAHYGV